MTAPKKVKVGTSQYPVNFVERYPADFEIDPAYGATDTIAEQIYLKVGLQSEAQLRDSLLHETLHAIFARSGMNLPNAKEERIISRLVPWLLMVIQDNPKLVAYLQEKVK